MTKRRITAQRVKMAIQGWLVLGLSYWGFFIGSKGEPYLYVWPVALLACLLGFLVPFEWEQRRSRARESGRGRSDK